MGDGAHAGPVAGEQALPQALAQRPRGPQLLVGHGDRRGQQTGLDGPADEVGRRREEFAVAQPGIAEVQRRAAARPDERGGPAVGASLPGLTFRPVGVYSHR